MEFTIVDLFIYLLLFFLPHDGLENVQLRTCENDAASLGTVVRNEAISSYFDDLRETSGWLSTVAELLFLVLYHTGQCHPRARPRLHLNGVASFRVFWSCNTVSFIFFLFFFLNMNPHTCLQFIKRFL